jgi:hypothetical protein
MALKLSSTDKNLQALLEEIWKDNHVNAVENLKLRKQSDAVADAFKDSPAVAKQLGHVQMLVDLLADKLKDLSVAVYQQNIRSKKAEGDTSHHESSDLQTHALLDTAAGGDTDQLIAADDHDKRALMEQREALIRAIEYQIAYLVIAVETTTGRLKI